MSWLTPSQAFSSSCTLSLNGVYIDGRMQVLCNGKEDRLLDCSFPESFKDYRGPSDYINPDYYSSGDFEENWAAPAHVPPAPAGSAPTENAPPPSSGLIRFGCGADEQQRLAVICRRFDITGMLRKGSCTRVISLSKFCQSVVLASHTSQCAQFFNLIIYFTWHLICVKSRFVEYM